MEPIRDEVWDLVWSRTFAQLSQAVSAAVRGQVSLELREAINAAVKGPVNRVVWAEIRKDLPQPPPGV